MCSHATLSLGTLCEHCNGMRSHATPRACIADLMAADRQRLMSAVEHHHALCKSCTDASKALRQAAVAAQVVLSVAGAAALTWLPGALGAAAQAWASNGGGGAAAVGSALLAGVWSAAGVAAAVGVVAGAAWAKAASLASQVDGEDYVHQERYDN